MGNLGFFGGTRRESDLPSCFEGILGVPFESVQGNQALSLDEGETQGPFNLQQEPQSSFQVSIETDLLLRCEGKVRIPLELKQENQPSSLIQVGNRGLFLKFGGKLGVPLEWRWGSQGTSSVA